MITLARDVELHSPLRADNRLQVCKSDGGVAASLLPHRRRSVVSPPCQLLLNARMSIVGANPTLMSVDLANSVGRMPVPLGRYLRIVRGQATAQPLIKFILQAPKLLPGPFPTAEPTRSGRYPDQRSRRD